MPTFDVRSPESFKPGVMILAAGMSTRMGRPKILLPWNDSTIIGHLIGLYRTFEFVQLAIVTYRDDQALIEELDRLRFPSDARIFNPESMPDMFSSVLCGIRWKGWREDVTHFVIVLGDQPQVKASTISDLMDFARNQPRNICQPRAGERNGHPVILPRTLAPELSSGKYLHLKEAINENSGMVRTLQTEDSGVNDDIDTPADYREAKNRYLSE